MKQLLTIIFLFFALSLYSQDLTERWNHKYIGLVDENGDIVIPIEYDEIYEYCNSGIELYRGLSTDDDEEDDEEDIYYYDDDYNPCNTAIVVKKDGKYGLMSRDNEVIVPLECSEFDYASDYFFLSKDGKWGLFDEEGDQILPFEYDYIDRKPTNDNYIVMKGGLYGVIDREKNQIIPLKYAKLNFIGESFLVAKNESSLMGVIDLSEKGILPFIYSKIEPALKEGNFIVATEDLKYGVVDSEKNIVIPPEYGSFKRLNSDTYLVESIFDSSIVGVLDTSGVVVVPFKYREIRKPNNGLWMVSKDGNNYGFINKDDEIVIPLAYHLYGWLMSSTMFILREVSGGKWVILNAKGERLTEYHYDDYEYSFSASQIILGLEGKFGLVNEDLSNVLPFEYDNLEFTSSVIFNAGYVDLLFAKKNGKWGYISNKSKVVVPFIYEEVIKLSDETRAYLHDGKWTIINNFGKITTPETFDEIFVDNDYCVVRKNDFYGIINKYGDIIDSIKYEKVRMNSFGDYEIKTDGKWGVMTIPLTGKGRMVLSVPCEYDSIAEARSLDGKMNGYFVKKNGKWGKLDTNYNIEIPCEYDEFNNITTFAAEKPC